jgi:lipid II:glycine glycyltransferase (peptidoglycan interpeptide bridge formation enzyme)
MLSTLNSLSRQSVAAADQPSTLSTARFTVSVDQVSEREWNETLPLFADASVYQSWAFGAACWKEHELEHQIITINGEVTAAAQVRVIQLPLVARGIAYLRWGPLWRRDGSSANISALHSALAQLRAHYVTHRKLVLRLIPNVYANDPWADGVHNALSEHGFVRESSSQPYRTLRLHLTPSLEQLRKSLDQKWRNQLNRAEKNGLTLIEGDGDDLYARFLDVYTEMMSRKQFETSVNVEEFRELQRRLPASAKMSILLAEKDGKTLATIISAAFGDTGIYLLGATSDEGMTSKASYLLQWRMIQKLKERNCRWYDLGGINPETNPGVYHFKSGITGNEAVQLGRYECAENGLSLFSVRFGERVANLRRQHKTS